MQRTRLSSRQAQTREGRAHSRSLMLKLIPRNPSLRKPKPSLVHTFSSSQAIQEALLIPFFTEPRPSEAVIYSRQPVRQPVRPPVSQAIRQSFQEPRWRRSSLVSALLLPSSLFPPSFALPPCLRSCSPRVDGDVLTRAQIVRSRNRCGRRCGRGCRDRCRCRRGCRCRCTSRGWGREA